MPAGRRRGACALLCAIFAFAMPAGAHHSIDGQYDFARILVIEGTLTRLDWQNPHVWLHFQARRAGGESEKWLAETLSPMALGRIGVGDPARFVLGGRFTIEVNPHRSGKNFGLIEAMTFPDGGRVEFRFTEQSASE